eukprot:3626959-Prymnesium_polylepis.1
MKPKFDSAAPLPAASSNARMVKGSTSDLSRTSSAGSAADRTDPSSVKEPNVAAPARYSTHGANARASSSIGWSRNQGRSWPKPFELKSAAKRLKAKPAREERISIFFAKPRRTPPTTLVEVCGATRDAFADEAAPAFTSSSSTALLPEARAAPNPSST